MKPESEPISVPTESRPKSFDELVAAWSSEEEFLSADEMARLINCLLPQRASSVSSRPTEILLHCHIPDTTLPGTGVEFCRCPIKLATADWRMQLDGLDHRCDICGKQVWPNELRTRLTRKIAELAASSSLLPVPSPLVDALQHGMNCPGLTPTRKDECTCGFEWRIRLRTEQEMHRAWKKRAEEAELELQTQTGLPVGCQPWNTPEFAELVMGFAKIGEMLKGPARNIMEQIKSGMDAASLPVGESTPKTE